MRRAVQKEYDTEQIQQMIIAGDHVFGAEIHECKQGLTGISLQEFRIPSFDAMCEKNTGEREATEQDNHRNHKFRLRLNHHYPSVDAVHSSPRVGTPHNEEGRQ